MPLGGASAAAGSAPQAAAAQAVGAAPASRSRITAIRDTEWAEEQERVRKELTGGVTAETMQLLYKGAAVRDTEPLTWQVASSTTAAPPSPVGMQLISGCALYVCSPKLRRPRSSNWVGRCQKPAT